MRLKLGETITNNTVPKVVIDVPEHCLGVCMNSFGKLHSCALTAALGASSLEEGGKSYSASPMIDCIEARIRRGESPSNASVEPAKVTLQDVHIVERHVSLDARSVGGA